MSKAIITEEYLTDIGDAIRDKLGVTTEYTPPQMAGAIESIPTEAVLEPLSVTENGTYLPEEGVNGFGEVTVDVPTPEPTLQSKTVTQNGVVTPDAGFVGLSSVNVDVAGVVIPTAKLADYGLDVSGDVVNASIADIFAAVPQYSRVMIRWTRSGDTARFGALASEMPGATYGMMIMDKGGNVAKLTFSVFNSTDTYVGNYSTTNNVGFSGWGLVSVTT